jgi:hypothetical protein
MRRFIPGLLAALMIVSSVSAKVYTNKTFLAPRSNNMNLAMEYTTWHKQTSLVPDKNFGGTIQAVGFYEESDNKHDLGKYFGVCNYNNGNSVDDFIHVYPTNGIASYPAQPRHWSSDFFLHTYNVTNVQKTLHDKIVWRPSREAYGVRLDYHQKLDKILKGLFFKVALPIVHVKTSMGWSSTGTSGCGGGTGIKQKLQIAALTLTGDEKSLADYLTGNVAEATYASSKQVALCKAKIHNSNSTTGIADIDVVLGYNFLYESTKHVNVNIGFTIPTGNDPDGIYLWEAIVGNHGHWALGFGLDSAFQLWQDGKSSLDFLLAFNYRYLFSATEKRTMGFKYPNTSGFQSLNLANKKAMYGHWLLAGKKTETQATPFANFLTRNMKVTPGSHFDGIVQLAFNYDNWTFDLGYNLFAKEQEDVRLKCNPCADACGTSCSDVDGWTDDTYGIALVGEQAGTSVNWNTATPFTNAQAYGGSYINREHLDLDACTNPSVVTHKIYGGIGYAFYDWDYPLMLGIGGSWEFETDNDSLEQWALWFKLGLTF